MTILLDARTRIILHGIANPLARYQCEEMLRHGTNLVGVVEADYSGSGKSLPKNVRCFQSVKQAVKATGAGLSMVFNPAFEAKQIVCDAIDAGVRIVICMTEHVPVHDSIVMRHRARNSGVTLIGPNSSGVLSPGKAKAGFFCEDICIAGNVGVITKSGSLSYAVMSEMKNSGIGVSTVVAIGGDAVKGAGYCELLGMFQADPDTKAIVLLGEIGGLEEEKAAEYIVSAVAKPVVAFVAGRSVPPGLAFGHAGAIIERGRGDYASKIRCLASAGVHIAENIGEIAIVLNRWQSMIT